MSDDNHGDTETQRRDKLLEAPLTELVIGAAIDVHRELGPGLLESVYESSLCLELNLRKLRFERQKKIPIIYKGIAMQGDLCIDLLVEGKVVVEIKSVEKLIAVHQAQLLTYLG